MGRVSEVNVGTNVIVTYKSSVGTLTDADVNKPVKFPTTSDEVVLATTDGDYIYGFIDSVETRTEDGKSVVGVQTAGRRWVTMNGSYSVGDDIDAYTNTAAATALGANWGLAKTHVYDPTTATSLLADLLPKRWKVIYGAGTTGTDALVESM